MRCNGATCKMQRGWTHHGSVHTETRLRAGRSPFVCKGASAFVLHVARRALHGEPLRRLPAAYMLQLRTAALPQPMRAVASAVPLTHSTDWPA